MALTLKSLSEDEIERSAYCGKEGAHLLHSRFHIVLIAVEHHSAKAYVINSEDIGIVKGDYVNCGEGAIGGFAHKGTALVESCHLCIKVRKLVDENGERGKSEEEYEGKACYGRNDSSTKEVVHNGGDKSNAEGNDHRKHGCKAILGDLVRSLEEVAYKRSVENARSSGFVFIDSAVKCHILIVKSSGKLSIENLLLGILGYNLEGKEIRIYAIVSGKHGYYGKYAEEKTVKRSVHFSADGNDHVI